jgi:hypothetical protein
MNKWHINYCMCSFCLRLRHNIRRLKRHKHYTDAVLLHVFLLTEALRELSYKPQSHHAYRCHCCLCDIKRNLEKLIYGR